MMLRHSREPVDGQPVENTFLAIDEYSGAQLGACTIYLDDNPALYPARPLQVRLQLEGSPIPDALLGAAALGDIGHLFPDTSPEYAGIDSKILLRRVIALVRSEGWDLANADITIALQAPKIGPLVPAMRSCLASVLEVDPSCVSVKATTTEHLGFVGRGEGCEAWAVVLLEQKAG